MVFTGARTEKIYALLPDGQGGVWVGSREGLARFSGGHGGSGGKAEGEWRDVLPAQLLGNYPPAKLGLGQDGNLHVETYGGSSFVVDVDTLEVIEACSFVENHLDITDCPRWQRAFGWGVSDGSRYSFVTQAECEQIAEGLASSILQPGALIAASADGEETWVVEKTSPESVRLTRQRGEMVQETDLPYLHVAALALGRDAWMILGERLVRVHVRTPSQEGAADILALQPFSFSSEAFSGDVRSLVEDQAGGVWAINGYDVLRYDELEQNWDHVVSGALSADAIAADPGGGGVWVAGRGQLLRATLAQQQSWPLPSVITGTPTALLVGQDHRLWLGTLQDGVWTALVPSLTEAWDEPVALEWRQFSGSDGLADELITVLSYGPDGHFYAGHHAGISVFDLADGVERGRWTTLPGSEAPDGKGWVNALAWSGEQLWVGYFNDLDLRSYADGQWTDYACPAELLGIGALLVDDDGLLWVGTTEGWWHWPDASKGHESSCHMLDPDGIVVSGALALLQDSAGRIWAGGREGVVLLAAAAPVYVNRPTPTPTRTAMPARIVTATPTPSPVAPRYDYINLAPITLLDEGESWPTPDAGLVWRREWRYEEHSSRVNAMLRDGRWLWVAMPEGLVRLDLRTLTFTRLGHVDAESGFSLAQVRALLLGPQGCLWAFGGDTVRYCANPLGIGGYWQFVHEYSGFQAAIDADGNLRTYFYGGRHGRSEFIRLYKGHQPPLGEAEYISSYDSKLPPTSDCAHWFSTSSNQGQRDPYQSPDECRKLVAWRERLAAQFGPGYMESVSLALDGDAVWFFKQRGRASGFGQYDLLRLDDEGRSLTVPWNFAPPGPNTLLVADVARTGVWVGTPDGLFFSDGTSVHKVYFGPADAVTTRPRVLELARDSTGGLWAATEEGLFRLDEETDRWQLTEIKQAVRVAPDDAGGLWAATRLPISQGNIWRFDGNNWQDIPPYAGWPCEPGDIVADGEGGLWLISPVCDFQRFDGQQWIVYSDTADIKGNWMLRDPGRGVYMGQGDDQIYHYDQERGLRVLPLPQQDHDLRYVEDIVLDSDGNLWLACRYDPYLLYLPPCEVLVPGEEDCVGWQWHQPAEPVTEPVYALLVDSQGDLWAGGKDALLHYDGARWERISASDIIRSGLTRYDLIWSDLRFERIGALAEDRQGRIWAAAVVSGFYVYDPTGE
jgi:ligand-binding sensor domain-containing protein